MCNNILCVENKCSGCSACLCACPTGAISMKENEEGFLYPYVDEKLCTNCGYCKKICPMLSSQGNNAPQKAYASYLKDTKTLKKSTSGGIFSALAKWFLQNGGLVFGCAYINGIPKHISVDNEQDLHLLMGSKYVQSEMGTVLQDVKKALDDDKYVLFSGTPCQVAGLQKFLVKDYDKLFCVDIICHGVPSRKIYRAYLDWLGKKYNGTVTEYNFRSKQRNDWSLTFSAIIKRKNNSEKRIEKIASIDPFYDTFLKSYTYRESCYLCPFGSLSRVGDITLGDFWGIETCMPQMNNLNGVSAVLINSQKGNGLFSEIKDMTNSEVSQIQDIYDRNGNLRSASPRPPQRDTIYSDFNDKGYSFIAKKYRDNKYHIKESVRNLFSNKFRQKLKSIIKK